MKNNIAKIRKNLNYTQNQIANILEINLRLYQKYEAGTVIPSVIVAIKIAKALHTTAEELYPDEE